MGPGGFGAGLWCGTPGDVRPVTFTGDVLEVGPGDLREVEWVDFHGTWPSALSGGQDGRATALNANGELAFRAVFRDGSEGVFVASTLDRNEPCDPPVITRELVDQVITRTRTPRSPSKRRERARCGMNGF